MAKWKPLGLPLPMKIVNQFHISGGISEINATVKNLKDAGVLTPTTSPIQLNYLACVENIQSWRKTLGYYKLNDR